MKKVIVFLFFIFYGFSSIALADEKPKSLNEIFTPLRDIVENQTNVNVFFRNWNNLEYFQFLSTLNDLFMKKDHISDYNIKKLIASKLSEIFGGLFLRRLIKSQLTQQQLFYQNDAIYLQDGVKESDIYYIPENLLDPLENIPRSVSIKNSRRHDGVLVKIKGTKITIYKVLESKLNYKSYTPEQSRAVLVRWEKFGIFIGDKLFTPDNIKVVSLDRVLSLNNYLSTSIELNNFEDLVKVYSIIGTSKKQMYTFSQNSIKRIARDIYRSLLLLENFSSLLNKMNEEFIDRILYLLKKYIQIYGKIPSLSDKKGLHFSLEKKDSVHQKDRKYFENDDNRKDLILTLYSIYRDDILFSIFKERISKFFTSEEIKIINSKINEYDNFTSIYLLQNSKEQSIETLVRLLGKENEQLIVEAINKYHISTTDPVKDLEVKYRKLYQYFVSTYVENDNGILYIDLMSGHIKNVVVAVILSHLDGFIIRSTKKLDIYLESLSKLRLSLEESFIIMNKFFDLNKLDCINISQSKIDYINNTFFEGKKTNFEIICFMFENKLEEMDIENIDEDKDSILKQVQNQPEQPNQENNQLNEKVPRCTDFFIYKRFDD